MARWRARLFGMWSLKDERGQEANLPTRHCQWVLAALMLGQGTQPRDLLARKVWPKVELRRALASLRNALAAINRTLGERVVVGEGDHVSLVIEIESDWSELRRELHLARTQPHNLAHIDRADEILGLLLLPGCRLDWINDLRNQMADTAVEVAELRAEAMGRWGELQEEIEAAERWRDLAPASAAAAAAAMRAHAAAGEVDKAGRIYRQLEQRRRVLPEELTILLAEIEAGRGVRPSMPDLLESPQRHCEYLAQNWGFVMNRAGPKEGAQVAEAAAEAARPGSMCQAVLLRAVGGCQLVGGDLEAAREGVERATRAADLIGDHTLLALAAANAASYYSEIADWKAANRMITRAHQSAEAARNPNVMAFVKTVGSKLVYRQGDSQQAKEMLLSTPVNDIRIGGMIQAGLAQFYDHDENWREAYRWANAAVTSGETVGHPALRCTALSLRGVSHAGREMADEARLDLRHALELVCRYQMLALGPAVLDRVGQAWLMMNEDSSALCAFAASKALRSELGNLRAGPDLVYEVRQRDLEARLGPVEIEDAKVELEALVDRLA